jgi:hypothetical protein
MRTAMQNLHERWGLSASEIARALDISQRVARLARDGSEPAEGAEQLADFLEELDLGEDAGAYMSMPIVEGYTATGWDVYAAGRAGLLLALARSECTAEQVLSALDQDWRRNYWTSFTTFVAEDGNLSTRGKTYDEVRAQI